MYKPLAQRQVEVDAEHTSKLVLDKRLCYLSFWMELREFAERVLFARTLQDKLEAPSIITDDQPGSGVQAPKTPGRPAELQFKGQNTGKTSIPQIAKLDRPGERGRLLHFFANHELLATELMALVLLRFPGAPRAFRRAVLQTLKDEQNHTRWYLTRMQECGVSFGEQPVSGYFWRAVSCMESPIDYVTSLSLTFEQANLDFARFYSRGFALSGDTESSLLLERIYQDEIGHVACGLKWFRKWKEPNENDWNEFKRRLKAPLSPQRAKGPKFNVEGRIAAGFDHEFIEQLNVFAQSKGRTPTVFVFNPFAEARIAQGESFTPNKHQQLLQEDLQTLPQFLCRQDDVVLVRRRPSPGFLSNLRHAGYVVPEFVELTNGGIDPASDLRTRKLGALKPWAWGPDSVEMLSPLFPNLTNERRAPADYYREPFAELYSKGWSAKQLKRLLELRREAGVANSGPAGNRLSTKQADKEDWLCTEGEIGGVATTMTEALEQIRRIRNGGHHAVVIKEALGLAGDNAIRLLEPELLETQRRWIARAVEGGRKLVVEPWLERVADFSVQLEMGTNGLKLLGYTNLLNDWKGQYEGNQVRPGFHQRIGCDLHRFFPQVQGINSRVLNLYSDIFVLLEKEIRAIGYLGPVGIDAFVYRTGTGLCRVKPMVEINPRYTMGRLALELMRQVAPGCACTLRLVNRRRLESDGFATFADWAQTMQQRFPLRREGEPVPKNRSGLICLNEPSCAQVCLAVFEVHTPAATGKT